MSERQRCPCGPGQHRALSIGFSRVVSTQVLPLEALVTDAGEVTEAGKASVSPRVLQEALCTISGVPGLQGDVTNTEQLAQEMLILSHHPSLGLWLGWVQEGRALLGRVRGAKQKASSCSPPLQWQCSLDSGQRFSPG